MRSKAWRGIVWGGLIAGAMDLTAAFILSGLRGRSPVQVLHTIASGLLGQAASDGGAATAALGGVLHFVIAFSWAAIYWAASRKLAVLVDQAILCGLLYGVIVWLVMNLVVLPLSAFPHQMTFTPRGVTTGVLVLMFCIGLPIALAVRRASRS